MKELAGTIGIVATLSIIILSGESRAAQFLLTPSGGLSFGSKNDSGDLQLFPDNANGVGTDGTNTSTLNIQYGGSLGVMFGVFGLRAGASLVNSSSQDGDLTATNGVKGATLSSSWSATSIGLDMLFLFGAGGSGSSQKGPSGFYMGGGGEFNIAKYTQGIDFVSAGATDGTLRASTTGIGFKGFLGYMIGLGSSFGLSLEGGYRIATATDFKADEAYTANTEGFAAGSTVKQYTGSNTWNGNAIKLDMGGPYVNANLVVAF